MILKTCAPVHRTSAVDAEAQGRLSSTPLSQVVLAQEVETPFMQRTEGPESVEAPLQVPGLWFVHSAGAWTDGAVCPRKDGHCSE